MLKFKQLISEGKNLTVTHKDITRYFMLIPYGLEVHCSAGSFFKRLEIP